MRTNLALAALVAALALPAAAPSVARADHQIGTPFTGSRPYQLEFHAGLLWYGFGFAAGARFGIPVVHNGFVDSIDDAVYINFGIDFYYADDAYVGGPDHHYGFGLGIPVTLHWEFYFNDTWSAFAELGFQVFIAPHYFDHNDFIVDAGAWVVGQVGGTLHFSEAVGLTLRVGNPYISLGLLLQF